MSLVFKAPIKRQRLSEQIENKTQPSVVYRKPTLNIKTHRREVNGWRKIDHVNTNPKESRVGKLQPGSQIGPVACVCTAHTLKKNGLIFYMAKEMKNIS